MSDSNTSPLIVIVSGGGPVGLTFSLNLVMMMGKHVKISIYEGRWFVDENGRTRWQDEEQGKTRREQVVTLQDHVIQQMPIYIQRGLFQNFDERVWPTSRNIPIREVEDRLFALIQPFVQNGQVELIPEQLQEQTECLMKGDFDMLIGADGSNSFVRRYCNIPMISEGVEYACGVAYNIPSQVPLSEEPLHQALNCVLTVAQTRYLVNSSSSRRGYLNIRLIQSEYDELRERLQEFQSRNEALDLLDVNKYPNASLVWTIIRQGLEFFRISPKYVFRVLPIEINVRHASIVVRELRFEIKVDGHDQTSTGGGRKKYKTILACLAGDAALNVHFWPGRGMNSGMKAAMALARNIVRSCTSKIAPHSIVVRTPLRFLDFLDYEGFMARLRAREQQGRSLRVLIDPIDQSVVDSYSYAAMSHCYIKYTNRLIRKLKDMRQRLQERADWPHQARLITDEELQHASNRISPQAIAQLSLSNPWPTREMGGIEVVVEDTFPFDQKRFLDVPILAKQSLARTRSVFVHQCFLSLWIVDKPMNEDTKKLVNAVQNLPNFASATLTPSLQTVHTLKNSSKEVSAELIVVYTINEATQWMHINQQLIRKPGISFKVVTIRPITNQMTAVELIRAVRAEESYVPILIFTNKREEIQPALEFPNVTATDTVFDLYEFIGANHETQWNSGCRVSHSKTVKETFDHTKPSHEDHHSSYSKDVSSAKSSLLPTSDQHTAAFSTSLTQASADDHFRREPFLFWIDSDKNDPTATEQLRQAHPQLEIHFTPTFHEAKIYLKENLNHIRHRKTFFVICRGQYSSESKNVIDVIRLFDEFNLKVPIGVYTSNRESLSTKIPNIPQHIQVFDKKKQLLAFVQDNLNK